MGIGTHVLVELYGCPGDKLKELAAVRDIMRRIIAEAGFHAVGEKFVQFEPQGVTGVILLSESHFSIHTWPEKNMLAADIFACGSRGCALTGLKLLKRYFEPRRARHRLIRR